MFRVLTISREFGSGGGAIARLAAARLNWKLLDNALIEEIARRSHIDPALARRFDERVDSWVHRVARNSLWHGALEGVAAVDSQTYFDAEVMTQLSTSLIREAYQQGGCVIVGRGAQCILQKAEDVFHAYVYAPLPARIARIQERTDHGNPEALIRESDAIRAQYVERHYGCRWSNPHLYHLMVSSEIGEERAAETILTAMGVPA